MTLSRTLAVLALAAGLVVAAPSAASAEPPSTTITCGSRTYAALADVWSARGYKVSQDCSVAVAVDKSVPLAERYTPEQTAALTLLGAEPRYWAGWGLPALIDVCASRDASATAALASWPSMETAARALCPESPVWGKAKTKCDTKNKGKHRGHDRHHRRH